MITVDTRNVEKYSQLIPAVRAMYRTQKGVELCVLMSDEGAFHDLKEYLSEQGIGFREIYGKDGVLQLQFVTL